MGYIAALDIGVSSVGWAVLQKESETVIEAGSNLFPEATAAENLIRRGMRQGKRLKRRQRTRVTDFMKLWQASGFAIPDAHENDIVGVRVQALTEKISMNQMYHILYSYLKHRGISYLEDAEDDAKGGTSAYARGLAKNEEELKTKFPCQIQKERLEEYGKYRGQSLVSDGDGETIELSNVFTIHAYRKEIERVFTVQKQFHPEITDAFEEKFLELFNRKRKYYEGPGNEKSRTDYGIYTTKIGEDGKFFYRKEYF